MPFPHDDPYWNQTVKFIDEKWGRQVALVGPPDFLSLYPGVYPYEVVPVVDWRTCACFVLHKGMIPTFQDACLLELHREWKTVFSNEVFLIFVRRSSSVFSFLRSFSPPSIHEKSFHDSIKGIEEKASGGKARTPRTVLLVTTYNRPHRLRATLESLVQFRLPILVVDDGSDPVHSLANSDTARDFGVGLCALPGNRGLPNALNTGLGYWLADPAVDWISYFQDDVEVRSDAMDILGHFQHPQERPLLSGRFDPFHHVIKREIRDGLELVYQRSCPGIHLHAHRDYWLSVLPIPTPYLGAPKRDAPIPGKGADEDFWITSWAPRSMAKRGGAVCVIPGLVRTTAWESTESTWSEKTFPPSDPLAEPVGLNRLKQGT